VTLCGLLAFDATGVWLMSWTVSPKPLEALLLAIAALVLLGAFYTRMARDQRDIGLARLANAIALAIALGFACQVATYLLATIGAPFRGEWLAKAGGALGFSWHAFTESIARRQLLHSLFAVIYPLHMALAVVALSALSLKTDTEAWRFLRAFVLCFFAGAIGLLILPALSRDLNAPSTAVRLALRQGTFTTIDLSSTTGLVSFPSIHAAVATLALSALWSWRRWRVPLAIFTSAMLLATISEGGHYLVDVLSGAPLGLAAWWAARQPWLARERQDSVLQTMALRIAGSIAPGARARRRHEHGDTCEPANKRRR
jgi:membrane-associated phospholipid phosphatase